MAANGATLAAIAAYYRISPARVAQILRRAKQGTRHGLRYGKTGPISTNITMQARGEFNQVRQKVGLKLGEAIEEAIRLFIEKYK